MNPIIWREWFNNKLYPLLFSLCIIVSLGAYLTLDALQQSVDDYIAINQKQIVGGDIILTNNQDFPANVIERINQLDKSQVVFDYQFNTIAYTSDASLLTRIKAVTSTYPLYGELLLKNHTFPSSFWQKGSVLVEQQVLSSLDLAIGDKLKIGEAQFTIEDEIITEPDRPLTAFGFGARIIMHQSDLPKTQLMGKKSRINYRIEIKTDTPKETQSLFAELSELTKNTKTTLKTAEQSNTTISNLSQNFLVFLKLLVIAVIILSAIGMMSVVNAFVSKQKNTNAIRSALGEKHSSIIASYRWLFLSMALVSVMFAWLLSLVVLSFGKEAFLAILPNSIELTIPVFSLFKALIIALSMTLLMIHLALNGIKSIKPVAVLHKHDNKQGKHARPWLWFIGAGLGVLLLLFSEIGTLKQSLQVFSGLLLVWFSFSLLIKALMWLLKLLVNSNAIKNWKTKLALQNIFRKGNQSHLFITSLSMTVMILGSISLLDYSIQQQLVSTYPEDAPNFFLLDVQTDQQNQLDLLLGQELTYYPVVRARIESVNGVKAEELKTKLGRYDNISRVFNLSYANELLPTEELAISSKGKQLFDEVGDDEVPLSILNSFAEFLQVGLGDKVTFNVQGIRIKAQITSIRKRLKRGPSPFFYFIFPPQVLSDAPQIRFATAKVSDQQRVKMQTQIAKTFPGITTLDGGNIAKKLKEFVDQLKDLVQIFTALSLFAGLLIFITSLVSTSQDRLRESFYYRMMGMVSKDMLQLTLIEFLFLGLFAFTIGTLIASILSYVICVNWFSIDFIFPWPLLLYSTFVICVLLILISLVYNNHVKKSKVITYLNSQS